MKITCTYDGGFIKIIEVDGRKLTGSCNQCGYCCSSGYMKHGGCNHLIKETVDNIVQYRCDIYATRPLGCAMWPLSNDDIPPGCGFRFEE